MSHNKNSLDQQARELLENALHRIRDLKENLSDVREHPIAIVGMAARLPGAPTIADYRDLLQRGESAIVPIPSARFQTKGEAFSAGLLENIEDFDHEFFDISPLEARAMDPQHRLLLEVSWEAMEDAGHLPLSNSTPTGVFIGMMSDDYAHLADHAPRYLHSHWKWPLLRLRTTFSSFQLKWPLPSASIRPALPHSWHCTSPHKVCVLRECDAALAGGCHLLISPRVMQVMARTDALSPTGHAASFDAKADGYVRGEGCAIVVLKRLEDALRDRDHIWAVLRGSAVRHDGRASTLTAPNPIAQEDLLRDAWNQSRLPIHSAGYIEAHGTGTPLGDPIELESLRHILGQARGCDGACYVGSAKSNVGHLEPAAGMAGLVRAVLALYHQEIYPQANFDQLNPHIVLEGSNLQIPKVLTPWPSPHDRTRAAGVSAFGMSGTIAHIVLEEASPSAKLPPLSTLDDIGLLSISAKSKNALRALAERYVSLCSQDFLFDLCRAAATKRETFSHRLVIQSSDASRVAQILANFSKGENDLPGAFYGLAPWRAHRMPTRMWRVLIPLL